MGDGIVPGTEDRRDAIPNLAANSILMTPYMGTDEKNDQKPIDAADDKGTEFDEPLMMPIQRQSSIHQIKNLFSEEQPDKKRNQT